MSTHPATVHRCGKCRQPTYLPTVAAVVAVEQEPPKRGDPIPPTLDGSLRNCSFCGARVIPRQHIVAVVETPPPPARGAPIPAVLDVAAGI